ncbi:MAG: ribosome small subunit-dependent GTPase A [bacterium]|nr:ribosome small subunit-dependent GTPase A [bacterium]
MTDLRTGRVVRVDAKVCHVEVDGEVLLASPRGSLFEELEGRKNPIAVGDLVEISLDGDPVGIERVLERRNYLGRRASSHDPREQVLVANVDQLFVVGSLAQPGFSSNRTDRILAACCWHEIPAHLVLNKIDLAREGELGRIRATYEAIPIDVIETCAKDGRGVDELAAAMAGKVSVFYGASGAGKSTLLNRMQPGLDIREGKVSKYWKAGRHTTSHSQLHALDSGGWAIDTPGIRVFRLHELRRCDVRDLFPDFEPFQTNCKFPNCTHDHEPDCAVFDAVDAEELAASRYSSYLEMLEEVDPETALDEDAPPSDDE